MKTKVENILQNIESFHFVMLRGRNHGSYWSLIMVNIKNAKVIDVRYIGVQVSIGVHLYRCMSA